MVGFRAGELRLSSARRFLCPVQERITTEDRDGECSFTTENTESTEELESRRRKHVESSGRFQVRFDESILEFSPGTPCVIRGKEESSFFVPLCLCGHHDCSVATGKLNEQ